MRDSASGILTSVLLGFLITAVIVGIQTGIQETSVGRRAQILAFELLQGQLLPFDPTEDLPVVVDISDIKESKDKEVIDLDKLREVITAIADQKPRAIAIDVVITPETEVENQDDLSEVDQKKIEANYFKFLDFCLQTIRQEKSIPIFVGVYKRTLGNSDEWLGAEKYKEIAATIILPKEETMRVPIWFKASPESEKLFSISASLAKAHQKVQVPSGLAWAVVSADQEFPSTERHLQENMEYADALVNYSKLGAIQQNSLPVTKGVTVRDLGEKFRNRIVILGDGSKEKGGNAADTFNVTGQKEPISGVYLHAAAAYTFVSEPMYEFKSWVSLLLDLLLSGFIMSWVAVARYRHLGQRKHFDWRKLQNRLVLGFLLGICALAFFLVRYTGILWLDFMLVMLALWVHPKVEEKFHRG